MSQPELDELVLRILFNEQGAPVQVKRMCPGCGASAKNAFVLNEVLGSSQLGQLLVEHLDHCNKSHDLRPKIMCGFEVVIVSDNDLAPGKYSAGHRMKCMLEKHGSGLRHHFELAIVRSSDL